MTQNPFVQKFTKEETDSVAKLKEKLPEILKNAFKTEEPEPYTLWGVALDKDSTDERLDVLLVKFLRARDLDLAAAEKMLTDSLAWRKEFKTDSILTEEFDESIFGSVGYVYKTDKEGRPVCYNFYGDLDQNKVFGDVEKFIRWRVQLMERGVQLIDFVNVDSMIQVHDYKGASMFGRSANAKSATNTIIKLMQDNYPEFLAKKFFVNIPWWGSTIFKLIRPLLPEATIKKFVVCSNDELVQTLTQSIDAENLPDVYKTKPKAAATEKAVKNEQPAAAEPAKSEEQPSSTSKPANEEQEATKPAEPSATAAFKEPEAAPAKNDDEIKPVEPSDNAEQKQQQQAAASSSS